MTQEYTPIAWQDETTSQQGTLINAERLNQMQTAHHFADGLEEVDQIPTADPGVDYHKIVYCTADATLYRWDGTEWTADIDDETKRLLQEEISRATAAEGELAQDLADETTARETADTTMQADITAMQSGKLDKQTASSNQTKVYAVRGTAQRMILAGYGPEHIPLYNIEETLFSKMPTLFDPTDETVVNYGWTNAQIGTEAAARAEADTLLGGRIDTEQARAEAAEQANAQAIANTYTKAETDTALALKADKATTYTKTEADTLLAAKADTTALATKLDTLSTAGLHAYTHNGATQSEVAVIDGTTASTIPIRDANGRLQAADPAPGATDKTLTTANWVSQTGDNSPNNLIHKTGVETISAFKTIEYPWLFSSTPVIMPGSTRRVTGEGWKKIYVSDLANHIENIIAVLPRRATSSPGYGLLFTGIHWTVAGQVRCKWLINKMADNYQDGIMISCEQNGPAILWARNLTNVDNVNLRIITESYNGGYATKPTWEISEDETLYTMTTDEQGNITGYIDGEGAQHTFLNVAVSSD